MTVKLNPVVASEDGKLLKSLPTGAFISDASIDKEALVSKQTGNIIISKDDGLYAEAPAIDPRDLVSTDTDNALTTDASHKLKVVIPEAEQPKPIDFISTDAGNALHRGTDDKLFTRTVSSDAGNLLSIGSDSGASLTASALVSTADVGNMIKVNPDDGKLLVETSDIAAEVKTELQVVSTDSGNLLSVGTDKGAFLSKSAIPEVTSYTAGSGIAISNHVITVDIGDGLKYSGNRIAVDATEIKSITVSSADKLLSLSSGNVLSATLTASYDENSNLILAGKDGTEIAKVYIPSGGSILKSVEIVTNPSGYPEGNYFKFTFTTASGDTQIVYTAIPSTSAIAAGNGIAVSTDSSVSTVSAKVKVGGGLGLDASGLYVSANYAMQDEVATLSTTVQSNTQNISTLSSKEATLETTVAQHTTDLSTVQSKVATTEASVSTLTSDMATVQSDMSTAKSDIATAKSDITTAKSDIASAQTAIETVKGDVQTLVVDSSRLTVASEEPSADSLKDGAGVLYPASDLL